METKHCLRAVYYGIAILLILLVLVAGCLALIQTRPSILSSTADALRVLIGDKAAVQLESWLFQTQDLLLKWQYQQFQITPVAPWPSPTPSAATLIAERLVPTETQPVESPTPASTLTPYAAPTSSSHLLPSPTFAAPWQPTAVTPMGHLAGEGTWTAYIQDRTDQVVGYRTYLQPDPSRPYTVVAVVAIDLRATRLHFVLGTVEPYSPNGPKRSGLIPTADRLPGTLLAMFNGGFKSRQGEYGAMADGVTALPPQVGLGTLAIYEGGQVRIGAWGTDILPSTDMIAYRQNGPLVIQKSQINPQVYNTTTVNWGYTVNGLSPTWRSAVGISPDGNTLYYFAGPSLTIDVLARVMTQVGVSDAIQLDINDYWVLFVAVRPDGNKLGLEALFPKFMKENINRYLWAYTRDYFYVTGIN